MARRRVCGRGRGVQPEIAEPAADRVLGRALSLDDLPLLEPRLAMRLQGLGEQAIADLSAPNQWLFRRVHQALVLDRGVHARWPAISSLSYDGERLLCPLFDPTQVPESDWPALLQGHAGLFPLTAREAQGLDPSQWRLEQRRDDADYLYPADHFRHYRGTALQKKRNLMKQCLAAHRIEVQAYVPALQQHALQVLAGWVQDKAKAPGEADDLPCRDALALSDRLGLQGFLHLADGQPAGFVLAEWLQPGVAVVRFAKGLARIKGISQWMFHHLASQPPQPLQWLNFEQDLGLANFRRTKQSYQPAALLPKWRARWRG